MAKRKKKPSRPAAPEWIGDHGTGTPAATEGTTLRPLEGNNPNKIGQRYRPPQSEVWKDRLSMRQLQAAQEIEMAFCGAQKVTSGGDSVVRLQCVVDSSPRPDAVVAGQLSAVSRLVYVMKPVPAAMRPVIEHIFWHNKPMGTFAQGREFYDRSADVKVALDLVANHMRY